MRKKTKISASFFYFRSDFRVPCRSEFNFCSTVSLNKFDAVIELLLLLVLASFSLKFQKCQTLIFAALNFHFQTFFSALFAVRGFWRNFLFFFSHVPGIFTQQVTMDIRSETRKIADSYSGIRKALRFNAL